MAPSIPHKDTPPLVAIYWDDAHGGNHEELEPGEGKVEPAPIVTVGWLVEEDEVGLNVACEQTSRTHYRGRTTVLKENVIAVKTLRKGSLWRRPVYRAGGSAPADRANS